MQKFRTGFFPAGMLLALAGSLLLTGCSVLNVATITGSGQLVTKPLPFTNFTSVSAASSFNVRITRAATPSVSITVDDNVAELLDVSADGGRLRLGVKRNTSLQNATLKAVVTMPEITALDLSGASVVEVDDGITKGALTLDLSGASRLNGAFTCGDAKVTLSGASHADLSGRTGDLRVSASGASRADLGRFQAKDVAAEANGASDVSVTAVGKLDTDASGASTILYGGNPTTINRRTSGASSIRSR